MKRLLLCIGLLLAAACSSKESSDDAVGGEDALKEDAGPDGGGDAGTIGSIVDARDGQKYPTIVIGGKTWLAKNLNFAIEGSSWCYDDDPASCARDGRLYTFQAARTACPAGFRLGSDADWKSLEVGLGMKANQLDREGYSTVRGTTEGTKAKSAAGFGVTTAAGYRQGEDYDARDDRTYFWTSSTRGGDVWRRRITAADPTIFRFTNPPDGFAISVRCVRD